MKEFLLHVWNILVEIWRAPEAQFVWLLNLLWPHILMLVICWLVLRWLWRKAYPPKPAKK